MTCTECGGELTGRQTVTCSKACALKRHKKSAAYLEALERHKVTAKFKDRNRAEARKTKVCPWCGDAARRDRRFCSRKCAAQNRYASKRERAERKAQVAGTGTKGSVTLRAGVCATCGRPTVWVNGTSFTCSRRCNVMGRHRIQKHSIFERDGYICWLCNEPTDKDAYVPNLMAPTVDHVIPRSLGGSDEPDNLRCAHYSCNCKRGNRAA